MAISREKKQDLVAEISDLINNSKAAAGAVYTGTSVSAMQELRKLGRENDLTIKVIKNRLLRVVLKQDKRFDETQLDGFKGQLVYAFSNTDEILPAQILAKFAKENEQVQLVVGLSSDGQIQDTAIVQALANLPTKDQLRGQFVSVLAAPMSQFMSVINGAQRGFAQVLEQRAKQL